MRAVFNALVDLRDSSTNRFVPMVMHNYARLMPRPAPAGPGQGPWLHPALDAYAVPAGDRLAVSDALTHRMSALLQQLIDERLAANPQCNLHLVDTRGQAGIMMAEPVAGTSGDWVNEIHLTPAGYDKCTALWADVLDPILG